MDTMKTKPDAGEKALIELGMAAGDVLRLRQFRAEWLERLGGGRIGEVVRVAVVFESPDDTSDVLHVTSEPLFGAPGLVDRVAARVAALVEELLFEELLGALPDEKAAAVRSALAGQAAYQRGQEHGRQITAAIGRGIARAVSDRKRAKPTSVKPAIRRAS